MIKNFKIKPFAIFFILIILNVILSQSLSLSLYKTFLLPEQVVFSKAIAIGKVSLENNDVSFHVARTVKGKIPKIVKIKFFHEYLEEHPRLKDEK